jgi:hypothetical protein
MDLLRNHYNNTRAILVAFGVISATPESDCASAQVIFFRRRH